MQGFAVSDRSSAYIALRSGIGTKTLFPTTAPCERIVVASGKPSDHARSIFDSCALVSPACFALSVRVLLRSNPKLVIVAAPLRSTGIRAASHIIGLVHASDVTLLPIR